MDDNLNMYSLIKSNLQAAGRVTYLHRFLYIGRHKSTKSYKTNLEHLMSENVRTVHAGYYDERLSGLLLIYPTFFVHMLEGSESSFIKLAKISAASSATSNVYTTRPKVLVVIRHIRRRLFNRWTASVCRPVHSLSMKEAGQEPDIPALVQRVVHNMYAIADLMKDESVLSLQSALDNLRDGGASMLPEPSVLVTLLNSKAACLSDFKPFTDNYLSAPRDVYYQERVWPVASEFIPFNPWETDDEEQQQLSQGSQMKENK